MKMGVQMNFNEQLQQKAADAEDILKKYLPEEEGYQKKVIEAMNYSVLALSLIHI